MKSKFATLDVHVLHMCCSEVNNSNLPGSYFTDRSRIPECKPISVDMG